MNQMQSTALPPTPEEGEREFSVLDVLIVLAKYKKVIIWLPVIAAIVSAAISFVLPNVYKAGAKLLPPQQSQSGASALLSQLGGAAGALAGSAGLKNPNDLYIGMLKSRTVADKLIAKFDLQKVYDVETMEKTRSILEANTTIAAGKDGLISIEVEDENKKLVAQLANAYVSELVSLTKVLAVTEASQRRVFFERQLEQSKDNLAKAEMALKSALDTHGVISVDADSRAIVETVGRLRAQISAKDIQISAMQAFVTTNNPEYKRAQEELISLRAELSKLENGRPALAGDAVANPGKQVGLENIKILRDVKYYQMLYELLAKQYEAARLDEAKDSALIQVLDPAIDPERKFKPKRSVLILVSTILALIAAVAWAFMAETRKKILADTDGKAQWEQLKTLVRAK
ncbi:Wzz/FepE/Etk N-terminal domain-containing protein [Janthinobacterium sp.]|uniref:GumC family protein n=1 Tax=Janthinobacterium sp. TaxID=1871054 RepID=UPI002607B28E|nr:Wzz/FepE/Etk N-terminal domain-containing protein [Janthinobacterium sp.]